MLLLLPDVIKFTQDVQTAVTFWTPPLPQHCGNISPLVLMYFLYICTEFSSSFTNSSVYCRGWQPVSYQLHRYFLRTCLDVPVSASYSHTVHGREREFYNFSHDLTGRYILGHLAIDWRVILKRTVKEVCVRVYVCEGVYSIQVAEDSSLWRGFTYIPRNYVSDLVVSQFS